MTDKSIVTPNAPHPEAYRDPKAAVDQLVKLYEQATIFLCEKFTETMSNGHPGHRYRAFYPEIRITTTSFAQVDSRLSFGHVSSPGMHAATITRPDLFRKYLEQQIGLLIAMPFTSCMSVALLSMRQKLSWIIESRKT